MEPDDDLRSAIRRYAAGDVPPPDMMELRRRTRGRVVRQRWERGLAAAVVIGILIGVAAFAIRLWADPNLDQPIGPSPSPSAPSITPTPVPTPTPSASPTPTPPPSDPNGLPFGVNPAAGANPGPVGGVGDTIEGLRLDDVEITVAQCPNGEECPNAFTLTLTNATSTAGTWEVMAYTYYDSTATLGNGAGITLAPGETSTTMVTLDIDKDPSQGLNGTYTWNWSATRSNSP